MSSSFTLPSLHTVRHFTIRILRAPVLVYRAFKRNSGDNAILPLYSSSSSTQRSPSPPTFNSHRDDSQAKLGKHHTLLTDCIIFTLIALCAVWILMRGLRAGTTEGVVGMVPENSIDGQIQQQPQVQDTILTSTEASTINGAAVPTPNDDLSDHPLTLEGIDSVEKTSAVAVDKVTDGVAAAAAAAGGDAAVSPPASSSSDSTNLDLNGSVIRSKLRQQRVRIERKRKHQRMDEDNSAVMQDDSGKRNQIRVNSDGDVTTSQQVNADNNVDSTTTTTPSNHRFIYTPPSATSSDSLTASRLASVRSAFQHAWSGYSRYAWGHDEVRPVSNQTNDSWNGWAATMIDGLDTAMLMGFEDEVARARLHVEKLSFRQDHSISFFETGIRYLGGLLGAYELSRDSLYLEKAKELGDILLQSFTSSSSPLGIPKSKLHLITGESENVRWTSGASILAEIGSIQLEFEYLSFHTRDSKYRDAARKVYDLLHDAKKDIPGLYPTYISPDTGEFTNTQISFGSFGDSFYEYLLKLYILTEGRDQRVLQMYNEAMDGMSQYLVKTRSVKYVDVDTLQPATHDFSFIGELRNTNNPHSPGSYLWKQEHLTCFVPGLLALGVMTGRTRLREGETDMTSEEKVLISSSQSHSALSVSLLNTCVAAYDETWTGLGAEVIDFAGIQVKEGGEQKKSVASSSTANMESRREQGRSSNERKHQPTSGGGRLKRMKQRKVSTQSRALLRVSDEPEQQVVEHPIATADVDDVNSTVEVDNDDSDSIDPPPPPPPILDLTSTSSLIPSLFSISSPKYVLRPETIESVFYQWRLTHDQKWREKGWRMFENLKRSCQTRTAFSGVKDVMYENEDSKEIVVQDGEDRTLARRVQSSRSLYSQTDNWRDSQESFFFAETLKYYYLLFSSDDILPLDKYVFNTEAHPLGVLVKG